MTTASVPERGPIGELVLYFLRLGVLGFGGPVALVGQMERDRKDTKLNRAEQNFTGAETGADLENTGG